MIKLDTQGNVSVFVFPTTGRYEHILLTHLVSSSDALSLFRIQYFILVKFLLKNLANSSSSEGNKKILFHISLGKEPNKGRYRIRIFI